MGEGSLRPSLWASPWLKPALGCDCNPLLVLGEAEGAEGKCGGKQNTEHWRVQGAEIGVLLGHVGSALSMRLQESVGLGLALQSQQ